MRALPWQTRLLQTDVPVLLAFVLVLAGGLLLAGVLLLLG